MAAQRHEQGNPKHSKKENESTRHGKGAESESQGKPVTESSKPRQEEGQLDENAQAKHGQGQRAPYSRGDAGNQKNLNQPLQRLDMLADANWNEAQGGRSTE
ncbi:hypothetical protein K2Y11_04485 [bacterium]|nr:hypothetical protein [bacterium]